MVQSKVRNPQQAEDNQKQRDVEAQASTDVTKSQTSEAKNLYTVQTVLLKYVFLIQIGNYFCKILNTKYPFSLKLYSLLVNSKNVISHIFYFLFNHVQRGSF